jgi:protein SCO1/2
MCRVSGWRTLRPLMGVLLAAAVVAAPGSIARADGDPASDYLITNQVFLTSLPTQPSPSERQLLSLVRRANGAGFPIRVAVISNPYDLGSITPLWGKPQVYAQFLGVELSGVYKQRLLVVMPAGFGVNWPGHSAASAYRVLAAVPRGGDLAGVAQAAVRRLAAASGVALAASSHAALAARPRSSSVPAIAGGAAGLLVILVAFVLAVPRVRRIRRRRGRQRVERPRIRLRWLAPILGILVGLAIAVPIVALHGGTTQVANGNSIVTPPPFNWHAGQRPAPNFALSDQAGRPVSLAAYRDHPVIVTFIDPLCRNLCPLEAQVLNQLDRELPPSQRPTILAVSVDVYADTRADLLQDFREWRLVPEWRWVVGTPAQLAAVWNSYGVGVKVTTKRIDGTTIRYITHTEAAYVIDATGHERALFFWPFYPQDVKRVLRQLS